MKKAFFTSCILLIVLFSKAQTQQDSIKQTALNYIEGWYEGNAARMEKSLHPDLAKRIAAKNADGSYSVQSIGALELVQGTKKGYGTRIPKATQIKEVTILDVYGNAAVVKIIASHWIDYLQIVRLNGEWKIVNVLWELKS